MRWGGGVKSAWLGVFLVQSWRFLVVQNFILFDFVTHIWIQRHILTFWRRMFEFWQNFELWSSYFEFWSQNLKIISFRGEGGKGGWVLGTSGRFCHGCPGKMYRPPLAKLNPVYILENTSARECFYEIELETWINLIQCNTIDCAKLRLMWVQKRHIDASSAQVTAPGLNGGFSFRGLKKLKAGEGMVTERPRTKEKLIWTARQVNHDLTSRFGCYRCSTLFNYNRYSCTGAFFDLIEWLKDDFLDLYLYFIFWMSTISRFWICWDWLFIIFDERNIFLGPQGPTGTRIL